MNAASVSGWSEQKNQCYSIAGNIHLEDTFSTEAETIFTTSVLALDSLGLKIIQVHPAISFTLGLPWCQEI